MNDTAAAVDKMSLSATSKPISKLARVLSMVPESKSDEEYDAEEDRESDTNSFHVVSDDSSIESHDVFADTVVNDTDVSHPLPLKSFACQGFLPRPDGCFHVFEQSTKSGLNVVHLDRVPFTVRPASINDAAALHRLQGHVPDNALRSRLSFITIQKLILKAKNHSWQWVAETDGNLVAAILLGGAGDDLMNTSVLEFKMVAVHPAVEERAEVLFALINFAVQLLVAEPGVNELRQGNLMMSGLQAEKSSASGGASGFEPGVASISTNEGPDSVVAKFRSPSVSGKFDTSQETQSSSLVSFPYVQMNPTKGVKNSSSGINQREAIFTAGISLDDIAWIIAQVATVANLEAHYTNGRKSENGDKQDISEGHRRTTDAVAAGRRRSKLLSIVEEARRLTSSAGFNDQSKYYCIEERLNRNRVEPLSFSTLSNLHNFFCSFRCRCRSRGKFTNHHVCCH